MKIILNKTRKHSERYTLVSGSQGCVGKSSNHANWHLQVVRGMDRGLGYQGYSSVSYFLSKCRSKEIRSKIIEVISSLGYIL